MNDFYSGSASWRLSFLLLSPEQQRERVRELARLGWSEPAICGLSGWSVDLVRKALSNTVTTTTTTGEQT